MNALFPTSRKLIRNTLISGLSIFAVCSTLILLDQGYLLLLFLFIIPGFIYGLAIGSYINIKKNLGLFIWASTLVYIICFYLIICSYGSVSPVKIILCGWLGAALLFVCYYFLINKTIIFLPSFVRFSLAGIIGSIPSAICCYFFDSGRYSVFSILHNLFYIGINSVFPLWQFLFSLALLKVKKRPELEY